MKAISQNHLNVVNYLLSCNANINLLDSHGLSYQDIQNELNNNNNTITTPTFSDNNNHSDDEDNCKTNIELKEKIIISNNNITNQLNGFICPLCLKETFSVVRKKDSYICINCSKKRISLLL